MIDEHTEYTDHLYYAANWLISSSAAVDKPYSFFDFLDSSIDFEVDLKFTDVIINKYEYLRFVVRADNNKQIQLFTQYGQFLGLKKSEWVETTRSEYVATSVFSVRQQRQLPNWEIFGGDAMYNLAKSLFGSGMRNETRRKQQST